MDNLDYDLFQPQVRQERFIKEPSLRKRSSRSGQVEVEDHKSKEEEHPRINGIELVKEESMESDHPKEGGVV
jgi:hypothetical protein